MFVYRIDREHIMWLSRNWNTYLYNTI